MGILGGREARDFFSLHIYDLSPDLSASMTLFVERNTSTHMGDSRNKKARIWNIISLRSTHRDTGVCVCVRVMRNPVRRDRGKRNREDSVVQATKRLRQNTYVLGEAGNSVQGW